MAKNITIAEGGSAKTFTAKKIKTKLTSGGTQNWVPEDEAVDYVNLKKKTIKENGTYDASDDNADGYSSVTVDIPSKVKEKTLTANGEYSASDDGVMGYSRVTVSVPQQGIPGPYKVNFYDKDRETLLETVDNVEYGGGAIYHGPTPATSGMRFVGWSPNPQYITGNTNCFPRFENLIYSNEQITDDWVTIAKNCRRNPDSYAIGQWKLLEISSKYKYPEYADSYQWVVNARMELAGKGVDELEGENGYANTSWVARIGVNIRYITNKSDTSISWGSIGGLLSGNGDKSSDNWYWPYSSIRLKLQTEALDYFPPDLVPYLRNVIKYTRTAQQISHSLLTNYPTVECLSIPSARELLYNYDHNSGWVYTTSYAYSTIGASYDSFFPVVYEEDGSYSLNSQNNINVRATKMNNSACRLRDTAYTSSSYRDTYWLGISGGSVGIVTSTYNNLMIQFCI